LAQEEEEVENKNEKNHHLCLPPPPPPHPSPLVSVYGCWTLLFVVVTGCALYLVRLIECCMQAGSSARVLCPS
jgi:hypothetical protein